MADSIERPIMVCLCGPTRLRNEILDTDRRLTLTGSIVLRPALLDHGAAITEEQRANLATLHLRKIDIADEILVVDTDGPVDGSTAREVTYARWKNKPVYFLSTMHPLDT